MNQPLHQGAQAVVPLDIVVVDDDQLTLDIISWIFGKSQSRCQLFTDPGAAMVFLCKSMPRVLVVDYYMPAQSGIEFITDLKASTDIEGCSIFLCSAVSPRQDTLDQIDALGARVLDKSQICNRSSLLSLLHVDSCVTGNK